MDRQIQAKSCCPWGPHDLGTAGRSTRIMHYATDNLWQFWTRETRVTNYYKHSSSCVFRCDVPRLCPPALIYTLDNFNNMMSLYSTLLVVLGVCSSLATAQGPHPAGHSGSGKQWVSIFGTMPQLCEPANLPPAPFVSLYLIHWKAATTTDHLTEQFWQQIHQRDSPSDLQGDPDRVPSAPPDFQRLRWRIAPHHCGLHRFSCQRLSRDFRHRQRLASNPLLLGPAGIRCAQRRSRFVRHFRLSRKGRADCHCFALFREGTGL